MLTKATSSEELTHLLRLLLGGTDSHSRLRWQKTLGVSAPAISQWSTGKNLPRPETLLKILIEHTRQHSGPPDSEALASAQSMGLRPAVEVSNLLVLQGYSCLSAYLASAVAARIGKQLDEVLPDLPPKSQIELLGHLQSVLDLHKSGNSVPESAGWLRHRYNVREEEIESVSNSFIESILCSVRHSQMLSTLHSKHRGHIDEFLESVMFLTAWNAKDITVFSGDERLDSQEAEPAATPEEVIQRIKPKRATVRYRRLNSEPDPFRRVG